MVNAGTDYRCPPQNVTRNAGGESEYSRRLIFSKVLWGRWEVGVGFCVDVCIKTLAALRPGGYLAFVSYTNISHISLCFRPGIPSSFHADILAAYLG